MAIFADRRQGGRALGARLREFASDDTVVLALPRGGVPVAFEVATALDAQLDVLVVRKLGVPGFEELAMGAIASGGVRVLNDDVIAATGVGQAAIDDETERERHELERREAVYRDGRPQVEVAGQRVILVDDGLATGATMRAAVRAVRILGAREVIVAVPVGARDTCEQLAREADACVCVETPEPFDGVGRWYRDFRPTSDAEVRSLLAEAAARTTGGNPVLGR